MSSCSSWAQPTVNHLRRGGSSRSPSPKEMHPFGSRSAKTGCGRSVTERAGISCARIWSAVTRPIHHQKEARIEAHIFVAFIAYTLNVTLGRRLRGLAPGLTTRSVLEKFKTIQMIDVHLPTTDGRTVIMSRYTQPEFELQMLLKQLRLSFPSQPPPRMIVKTPHARCSEDFLDASLHL